MRAGPKVTVFIPVYNREHHVAAAVESILAQSFGDFELLVVDDGSTDASCDRVRAYADRRIRLVSNDANLGIPKTRNRGLTLARGEYIALLDSDDWAYPRRLERQVRFLDAHPDYAAVGAWAAWMDERGRPLAKRTRRPAAANDLRARCLFWNCLINTSSMGRTAIMRAFGYRERFVVCQDFDLWVRISAEHKLGNLPETLVRRRRHERRVSREAPPLMKEKTLEIIHGQLLDLGLNPSAGDLDRHFALPRMRKLNITADAACIDWAEEWLQALREANQRTRRYPEPAFSRMLGSVWLRVCRRAMQDCGWRGVPRLLRSPLRHGVLSSVYSDILLHVFRHAPQSS